MKDKNPFSVSSIDAILQQAVPQIAPAIQLVVLRKGKVLLERTLGWIDPETRQNPITSTTLFDLASVSKLFVTTAFLSLSEQGTIALDQSIVTLLPEFAGQRPIRPYEHPLQTGEFVSLYNATGHDANSEVDARQVTFRHLLTHTSGLPAWRPLFRHADAASARQMALETFFSYPTGTRVIYSDIGLILTGIALERLTGDRLDEVVRRMVLDPLTLRHTNFLPIDADCPQANASPTEFCQWRQRRVQGEVHDENAAKLGGVAGHAGIFSTAHDVARFGQIFLQGGAPILQPETVAEMTRLQTQDGDVRRGIGFALWSPDPQASSNPFSQHTFGHTGFTGTSLLIDPERQLVVALLTNDVYHGRQGRGILPLRVQLHQAIVNLVDGTALC